MKRLVLQCYFINSRCTSPVTRKRAQADRWRQEIGFLQTNFTQMTKHCSVNKVSQLIKSSHCLSICLSVYIMSSVFCLSVCPSVYLSFYLPVCLSTCLFASLSICLSVSRSAVFCICLSVFLSVCLSSCPSVNNILIYHYFSILTN